MTRYLFAAAVLCMGLGMVLVYGGVIAAGLMIPGTALVGIGIVLFGVAAVVSMMSDESRNGAVAGSDASGVVE